MENRRKPGQNISLFCGVGGFSGGRGDRSAPLPPGEAEAPRFGGPTSIARGGLGGGFYQTVSSGAT